MTWPCRAVAAACIVVGLASPSAAGQVKLVIRDGLVTLEATDATLREIFAEWARVGQTRVVNAESAPSGPMTVQLTNVPERQALETLLRPAAGFLAVQRAASGASASMYERIVLMPGLRPAIASTSAPTAPFGQSLSSFSRDRILPQPAVIDDNTDDDQVPNMPMRMPGVAGGAAQPGMPTVPFNGAGMASPNATQGQPGTQGSPYGNPYGMPYGVPSNPNQQVNPNGPATGTPPRPAQSVPQPAPRPGMTTPPVGPIKGPVGSGAAGVQGGGPA
jgi:hypothetical protein